MSGTTTLDRWRAVAAATGAADRAAAEAGVRLAYRTAGLVEPERVVWADSPRAAVTAIRELTDAGRSVRDEVRTRPWAEERRRVHDALGPGGWAELWTRTGARLWDTTRALAERIRTGVAEDLAASPDEATAVRLVLLDAVLGQHDAAWLAAFEGRDESDGRHGHHGRDGRDGGSGADGGDGDDGGGRLAGLAAVAEHAGWWWPYEKAVVLCERPVELHRDEAGRLDRGDGPALAFRDGFALYAWRGMPVSAEFLGGLGALTPERIRAEENAELRRVMLEYYGYDRYLTESGARPVHRDGTGVLWRIELVDDEDVAMVEVVNATPEPDGTFRTYWLRVPPETATARQGVAWTFGLAAEAYEPLVQT
ncbi:DUF6745 domain-containing protein [Streptomyces sp. NPDC015346]|uniref:DUF6745 domain-containing protein n=1 Tax=Streptomyces sp. NPDC015346 TaxID=3364954 RepID=UPI0036F635F8